MIMDWNAVGWIAVGVVGAALAATVKVMTDLPGIKKRLKYVEGVIMKHEETLHCHGEKITVNETTNNLFLGLLQSIKTEVEALHTKIDKINERQK